MPSPTRIKERADRMAKEAFDPTPARRTFGEGLVGLRGLLAQSFVAGLIIPANEKGVGISRQAMGELEGRECRTCRGSGRQGPNGYCDVCGGSGMEYVANPTLRRIEEIAMETYGVVPEIVFVYPPDHPAAGQIVAGVAPKLEAAERRAVSDE